MLETSVLSICRRELCLIAISDPVDEEFYKPYTIGATGSIQNATRLMNHGICQAHSAEPLTGDGVVILFS